MKDYRLPEHRHEYFDALYKLNLEHQIMPGLVYMYMPALAERYGWDAEQKLWFAFLNGLTQNPITSLRLFDRLPEMPPAGAKLTQFDLWFNENWETLQFDTDRRYGKKETVEAIKSYARLVSEAGSQVALYAGKTYSEAWETASKVYSFGRLSTFSYLEYVNLNGFGPDCDNLMFEDFSGSRSHRNGALFLLGQDSLVFDKRAGNGFDGKYSDFKKMCSWLNCESEKFLRDFKNSNPAVRDAGNFTLESQFCQFKNGFFGRRSPGIYSDMAWERIVWADSRGQNEYTEVFKDIRSERLPSWLRMECESKSAPSMKARKEQFKLTGSPFRAEWFLNVQS